MESNKTEILSFDKWFGEASQNKLFWESPSKASKMGFEAGEQSKQVEVDGLQKRVKELELINFDSELHFDATKEHIDHLQKKIDDAISCLEKNKPSLKMNYKHAINALSILKGEQS